LEPAEKNNFNPQFLASSITIAFLSMVTFVIPDEIPVKKLQNKLIRQEDILVKNIVKVNAQTGIDGDLIEKVVITAPPKQPDAPIYPGIADSLFPPDMKITPVDYNEEPVQPTTAVYGEQRDFTIPEAKAPLLPVTVTVPNHYPYVPNSSYSFYKTDDSVKLEIMQNYVLEKIALEKAIRMEKLAERLSVMYPEIYYPELQEVMKADSLKNEQEVILLLQQAENKEKRSNTKKPRVIIKKRTVIVHI
jgi:hypothetical protein